MTDRPRRGGLALSGRRGYGAHTHTPPYMHRRVSARIMRSRSARKSKANTLTAIMSLRTWRAAGGDSRANYTRALFEVCVIDRPRALQTRKRRPRNYPAGDFC